MAKIVITVEDSPDGKVRVTANPTFEQMVALNVSGQSWTSAHGYAFAMLNEVRRISRSNDPTNKILLPRIGR